MKSSNRFVVLILLAANLMYFFDLQMVICLGSNMVVNLGRQVSDIGYLQAVSYTAATISGILCAPFIDRYNRKSAFIVSLAGLAIASFSVALSNSFWMLLIARGLIGFFTSPFLTLIFAILADLTPKEKQAASIANVMMAYPISMSFGIPIGLGLASWLSWKAPFAFSAFWAISVIAAVYYLIPDVSAVVKKQEGSSENFFRSEILLTLIVSALVFFTNSLIVFTATAYYRHNLSFNSEQLSFVFFVAGIFAIACNYFIGKIANRLGPIGTCLVGTAALLVTVSTGFIFDPPLLPVIVVQSLWVFTSLTRQVSLFVLGNQVHRPQERGRFLSLQTTIRQLTPAIAALAVSGIITEGQNHSLVGMSALGTLALVGSVAIPVLFIFALKKLDSKRSDLKPIEPEKNSTKVA